MQNEIIVVEQLPVITEHLQTIKAEVTEKVQTALSLLCTEETIQEVKKSRAELSKEFQFWEEKRKAVKTAVLSPYEQFEAVYKDCITNVFKTADAELKGKIDNIENELKEQKRREISEYFDEYKASRNLDFPIELKDVGITVTLSASIKSLKEKAKAYIDKVCNDLDLIATQEYANEILYDYKMSKDVSFSIQSVVKRHKAIEEAQKQQAEYLAKQEAARQAEKKVEEVITPAAEVIAPPIVEEKPLTVTFTVTATRTKLKELKEFLKRGEYKYE